ncbi:MAG: c-type cytochrome, partial [bacterium]|nr:c-type cytochrome [bacterium]
MPHRLSVPLLAAIVSLFIVGNVRGDESAAPFVAGFDRFVKNEIASMSVGRKLLLSELNCTACHQSSSPLLAAKRGPDLSAAGSRLQLKWMEDYLQNPQKVKPGATMPDVLAGVPDADKSATAKALAAYLVTQTKAFPQLKATGKIPLTHEFWKFGDAEKGQATYHQIGCVACHEADTEYDAMEHPPS